MYWVRIHYISIMYQYTQDSRTVQDIPIFFQSYGRIRPGCPYTCGPPSLVPPVEFSGRRYTLQITEPLPRVFCNPNSVLVGHKNMCVHQEQGTLGPFNQVSEGWDDQEVRLTKIGTIFQLRFGQINGQPTLGPPSSSTITTIKGKGKLKQNKIIYNRRNGLSKRQKINKDLSVNSF